MSPMALHALAAPGTGSLLATHTLRKKQAEQTWVLPGLDSGVKLSQRGRLGREEGWLEKSGVEEQELTGSQSHSLQACHAAAQPQRGEPRGQDPSFRFSCALAQIRSAGLNLHQLYLYCGNNCSVKRPTLASENINN